MALLSAGLNCGYILIFKGEISDYFVLLNSQN